MSTPHCSICYGIYAQTEGFVSTSCGHLFHSDCLSQWMATSQLCPKCRESCPSNQLRQVFIDFASDEDLASVRFTANSSAALKTLSIGEQQQNQSCECCALLQAAVDNYQTENYRLINALDNEKQEKQQLEMGIRANEHNLRVLRERVQVQDNLLTHKSNVCNNDAQLKASQKEVMILDEKLKELTNQLNKAESDRDQFEQLVNAKERENVILRDNNQKVLKRLEELQLSILTKSTELQAKHNEITDMNDQLQTMKMKHDNGETERDKLAQSLKDMEQKNEQLLKDIQKTTKHIDELNKDCSAQNLQALKERLDASITSLAAIQAENLQKEDTINTLKTRISYNEMELKAMDKDVLITYDKLKQMTNKYYGVESERSKLQKSLNDKQQENVKLLQENQKSWKSIEELQNTISIKNVNLKMMRDKIQNVDKNKAVPIPC